MTTLYLSRARLRTRRGEALASISPLLLSPEPAKSIGRAHRIVWMLFQDRPDVGRDDPAWRTGDDGFLWRDEGDGRFMILSRKQPTDPNGLFDLATKPFEPALRIGDRLRFALRANPTVASKSAGITGKTDAQGRQRGKRIDVVMHALTGIPKTDWTEKTGRAFVRDAIVASAVRDWVTRQGGRHGFAVPPVEDANSLAVANYAQAPVERRSGKKPAGISTVDITGSLTVDDPVLFLDKLARGFGSAKAFGCGLMLIRRA